MFTRLTRSTLFCDPERILSRPLYPEMKAKHACIKIGASNCEARLGYREKRRITIIPAPFCNLQNQLQRQRCIPSTARGERNLHIACRDLGHSLSCLIQDWTEAKMAMDSANAMMGHLPRLTCPTACIGASRPSASALPAWPSMMNQSVSQSPPTSLPATRLLLFPAFCATAVQTDWR